MSDEQTRLLMQILEVQKEHLAFAKQQREEFLAIQQSTVAFRNKYFRTATAITVFALAALLLLLVLLLFWGTTEESSIPVQLQPPASASQAK